MVTPAGARSYLVQYRIGGRGAPTRRYTIGKHGSPWTADKARDRAVDILEMVRKRIDPVEADRNRIQQAAEDREAATRLAFSDYADSFIKRHAEARQLRSVEDIRSVFRRDLKPFFGAKPITHIRRTQVRECLDQIAERSGSAANKAHKWLRKMFVFAVDRGDLASSPMIGMSPPHNEGRRQRVLKDAELATVWRAADGLGQPWRQFIQLLLVLGQRLREVAGMRWEELDLEGATWVIPGARTKNKREHLVPLSRTAIQLIRSLQADELPSAGPVLTTNGKTPISGFSKIKAVLDAKISTAQRQASSGDEEEFAPWVFHDLRRSVGTGCQALGFPIEHTEALLNHVSGKRGGLAAIYQLHDYRDEKRAALAAWSQYVAALVSKAGIDQ